MVQPTTLSLLVWQPTARSSGFPQWKADDGISLYQPQVLALVQVLEVSLLRMVSTRAFDGGGVVTANGSTKVVEARRPEVMTDGRNIVVRLL